MNSNHRPPANDDAHRIRWTAYALDQLDAVDRLAVESELAASDEARQFVADVRSLAGQVREVARQESSAVEPSAALAEALEKRLSQKEAAVMKTDSEAPRTELPSPNRPPRRSRRRWLAVAGAACLAAVVAVPAYQYRARESKPAGPREVAMTDSAASMHRAKMLRKQETRRIERRDSEVRPQIATNEEAAQRSARDHLDEREKFNADRSVLESTQSQLSATLKKPHKSEPVPYYLETTQPAAVDDSISAGGGPAPGEGRPAGEKPSEKAHYREYLLSVNKLIKEQRGIPDRGETTASPESKPSYTIAKPVYETKGREPATPPVADPQPAAPGRYVIVDDWENHPKSRSYGTDRKEVLVMTAGGLRPETRPGWDNAGTEGFVGGGTPGTEQYERIVENPFLPVAEQPQSTFSIDVDTASYANVRRFLTQNMWPPADAVRIEEMVNYFQYDYPLPTDDVPFSVNMEVAQCPWNPGNRLLRVGLKGDEIDRQNRGLSNLVFLLDVSGSMADQNKLPLVKQAMRLLVEQLDENDRVAIVTYAGTTGVHLESTSGEHRQKIVDAIERLSAGGSTNGSAGIQLAYQQAVQYFIKEGTNRVILCTDGDLNVGVTRDDDLVKLIKEKAASGVFLTVLGFGTGNLKDAKLEKLADHGNGIYAYVDSLREARKVLVEQLTGSLITIAKDVKLQIEFNPAEVASYRLIGYENRVMAARDFHDDKKDAGEIGAGHTVTALYELVPARAENADAAPDAKPQGDTSGKLKYQRGPAVRLTKAATSGELLTLSLRYKEPDAQKSKLLEFTARDSNQRIGEASKDFQFASAVAAFGMILRGSQYRGQATLEAVEEIAASAVGDDPSGYRAELVDLVRRAKQIQHR